MSKNVTRTGDLEWPSCSPDLNPCDFFLWGYLKSKVWSGGAINSVAELKDRITAAIHELDTVDRHKIANACNAFVVRAHKCIAAQGGHFE